MKSLKKILHFSLRSFECSLFARTTLKNVFVISDSNFELKPNNITDHRTGRAIVTVPVTQEKISRGFSRFVFVFIYWHEKGNNTFGLQRKVKWIHCFFCCNKNIPIHVGPYQHSDSVIEHPLCDQEVAGSIPDRVISKTLKMVLAGAQH